MNRFQYLGSLVLAAAIAACSGDVTKPVDLVRQVTISPRALSISTTESPALTAEAHDATGQRVTGVEFSWSSSDETVAAISPQGVVHPTGKRGKTTITVSVSTVASDHIDVTLTPPPSAIVLVSGGGQTGVVGQTLALPAIAELRATDGLPVAGVALTFAAPASGAVAPSPVSDDAGRVTLSLTLGTVAGAQSFTASASGVTLTIPATALAGAAATVATVLGDAQTDTVYKALANPLTVKVADRFNNAVAGATVTWTRTGAGSLSATSTTTGDDGRSSVAYTLGAAIGTESITATVAALPSSASFSVRSVGATADAVVIVSGNGQAAPASAQVTSPLVAKVVDARGFPVAGVFVAWSVVNGSLGAATALTNDAGETSNTLRLGIALGSASVIATITTPRGDRAVTFVATIGAATPARLRFRTQPGAANTGVALSPALEVEVLDQFGNPTTISNIAVTVGLTPDTGTPGAALTGNVTRSSIGGVATFNDVKVNTAGTGYTITATSPSLQSATSGALAVTEPPVTVSLTTINQCNAAGVCAPANLLSVAGRLDVTVTTDGNVLGTAVILKCGVDSLIAVQGTFLTASVASRGAKPPASKSSGVALAAPVVFNFSTDAFDAATGAVALKNGACTLRAAVKPVSSAAAVIASNASVALTLANADLVVPRVSVARQATDGSATVWYAGNVTVTALPVMYSGATAATATIQIQDTTVTGGQGVIATTATVSAPPFIATFATAVGAPGGVGGVAVRGADLRITVIDNQGRPITTLAPTVIAGITVLTPAGGKFNLDNQKPARGSFSVRNNVPQFTQAAGYVSGGFRFAADAAAGYCGPNSTDYTPANSGTLNPVCTGNNAANSDNAGVGGVTVTFQWASAGASPSFNDLTSAAVLAETNTSATDVLRMITVDGLGNADTSATQTFGVDKTPPAAYVAVLFSGPVDQQAFTTIGGSNAGGGYRTSGIFDNLSGPLINSATGRVRAYVAQTRNWSALAPSATQLTAIEGKTYSNTAGGASATTAVADLSPCMIGRFNAPAGAAGVNAMAAYNRNGALIGFCTPALWEFGSGVVQAVPAAADIAEGSGSTLGGYYRTEIVTADQAGNHAAPFISTILEDATPPGVAGIDLPGTAHGNTTIVVSGSATDNVDVVGSFAAVGYTGSASMVLRYPTAVGPGAAFDNTLTRVATVSPPITNFIRSLQANPGAASPANTAATAANLAQTVKLGVIDEVGLAGALSVSLAPVTLDAQSSSSFAANFNNGFTLAATNAAIWNCPVPTAGQTTGCGVAGTSVSGPTATTFWAYASGPTLAFNNPFTLGTFWYQGAGGDWVQVGTNSIFSFTDDGVNRTWAVSFAWDPPPVGADGMSLIPAAGGTIALNVRAIGINGSGDAIATSTFVLTLRNN